MDDHTTFSKNFGISSRLEQTPNLMIEYNWEEIDHIYILWKPVMLDLILVPNMRLIFFNMADTYG